MKQQLTNPNISKKCKIRERKVKICLQCGSGDACTNQYGVYCRSCRFLWDFE